MTSVTNHIKFGDGLAVTDEGGGVIRVDGSGGGGGVGVSWLDVGSSDGLTLNHEIGFYEVGPNVGNPTSGKKLMKWTFAGTGGGVDLLDTTVIGTPTGPAVKTPGMYALLVRIGADPSPNASWPAGSVGYIDLSTNAEPAPANYWAQQASHPFPLDNTSGAGAAIGTTGWTRFLTNIDAGFNQWIELLFGAPGTYSASGFVSVQRIY